ncbi:beta-N-acetylhexosaminidase [Halobacteriovorax sp. GB3]|uniref:beta-N-acetylhexosaminidase n=1 Tax=Halobacteriovorax sp. GB3 TaxID=2719615 RepID=UPI002362972B|nr:beta-N-acetylhexosaminidase [Halobacteriovorax sp. GB3]MDD0854454.1 beta-N-acetylhexosaminidase [Halobacteriovorax sp. GB3]
MNSIGQLIFTGLSGTSLTDDEREFLESEDIGGVILFSKNYENPAQLAELVNSIQQCRREYPLFIAVDHEGGRVIRFKSGFTQFPPMHDISLTESPKQCFHVHKIMADELAACGVNVNLAPVCDVWTNDKNKVIGDRAFGKDPETVSKFVSSAIRGLQTGNVLACAKHFPGHGDTVLDSHFDLPKVSKSLDELRDVEFIPFVKAVKSRVEFVMMAHIIVEGIDPKLPCSLSEKAHQILRDEMKYSKLIISDDMQMQAITNHYGVEEAAVMAINAGSDIVEYRDMEFAKKALEGLKEAVKTKKIKNAVLTERLQNIQRSKKGYFKEYKPIYIPDVAKKVGTSSSKTFVEELAKLIS